MSTDNNSNKISRKEGIGNIIRLARGDRTLREYAADAGVSYATIHLIEKGNLVPSIKMLRKLTSPQAKPQNDITYEAAMIAARYKIDIDVDLIVDDDKFEEGISIENSTRSKRMEAQALLYAQVYKYNSIAAGLIYNAIDELGIEFKKESMELKRRPFEKSISLSIDKGRIRHWDLDFACVYHDHPLNLKIKNYLYSCFLKNISEDTKISVVTNSRNDFEYCEKLEHKVAFRGELSIILVDTTSMEIIKEVYLSNYDLNDRSSEFILA